MNSGDHKVTVKELRWQCDPGVFKFDCTKDIAPLQEFIGQNRAIRAIEFGLSVDKPGYNIFVTGLTGTGRASAIKSHLEGLIKSKGALGILPIPNDWCYIHNFTDPDKPQIVQLPKGKGKALKNQMEELLKALKSEIAKVFSGEEYESESKRTMEEGQEKHRQLLQQLEKEAKEEGFTIQPSPMGVILIPLIDDKPATQAQYATLKEEEKEAIEAKRAEFMKRVNETLEKAQSLQKDTKERIKDLDRRVGGFAIEKLINELLKDYTDSPDIVRYLENIRSFTLDNIPLFRDQDTSPSPQPPAQVIPIPKERDIFLPFQVNVYVDNIESTGPPIVIESNPTFGNIFGKIDRRFIMGAFVTDHTMLKAGALSLANGGYLVLNARDVLITPGVWEAIKRAIKNKEVSLEDPVEQFGLIAPHGLKPQPMPIDVKVMLTGDNLIYRLLSAYDEDFWEVFKVKADFDNQIERTPENLEAYSGFICACCEREGLRHFHRSGVAKVLEHAVRMVGDQEKLSTRFGLIKDILIEADYWAQKEDSELVNGEHVKKAIDEKIYRSNLISERINELIVDGTIMVDVKGAVAGQINGLSVYDLGDFSFGKPSRITARIYMGRSGVINIERESQLSGKIHDKGVLILTGYLGWKHAQDKPLSLSASLCFEQSYEGIEGDSASSTELYAILSSLADVPLKQSIAITGSVNQKGEIQPIGGVNQKIEGFFDVCKAKGLTGEQGVIIPQSNIKNLMLREDVVEAVAQGQFHIYAVKTIDEGLEILTDRPAGERKDDGTYPEGTVNYLVDKRLRELGEGLKGFYAESKNV